MASSQPPSLVVAPTRTIVATYPGAEAAREAVAMLSRVGVAEVAISFVGDVAALPNESSQELVRQDRSMILRIFWAGLIWGGVGAVVGAAIGYVLALLSFPTDNVPIQIASWAMFVHIAATLWAAYAVIDDGTPRPLPRRSSHEAMVIVRSSDAALLALAEEALSTSTATAVIRS